ncbi:MAG: hypothetical protein ACLQVD_11970 [Capsulimonadaceae bacterium]
MPDSIDNHGDRTTAAGSDVPGSHLDTGHSGTVPSGDPPATTAAAASTSPVAPPAETLGSREPHSRRARRKRQPIPRDVLGGIIGMALLLAISWIARSHPVSLDSIRHVYAVDRMAKVIPLALSIIALGGYGAWLCAPRRVRVGSVIGIVRIGSPVYVGCRNNTFDLSKKPTDGQVAILTLSFFGSVIARGRGFYAVRGGREVVEVKPKAVWLRDKRTGDETHRFSVYLVRH